MACCILDHGWPVVQILSIIAKNCHELKAICHIYSQEETGLLSVIERMIILKSNGKISFNWKTFDNDEKKLLLLLYTQYLGAGKVLNEYYKNISKAPIFNGNSHEDTQAFISIWESNSQLLDNRSIEWHMPSTELWYDLFFLECTVTKLWPCLIEMVALQPYSSLEDPQNDRHLSENLNIDQWLENANNFYILMTLLVMEKYWNGNIEGYHTDTNKSEFQIISKIELINRKNRYRRIQIFFNTYELSGWIIIGSCRFADRRKVLNFPPSLRELQEREARILFVQRIESLCAGKKDKVNHPSSMEISVEDCSLPLIEIDMMSKTLQRGLDIWFICKAFGSEHYVLY